MATILPRSAWTSAKNGRAGRSLTPSMVTGITLHWPTGFTVMLDDTQTQVAAKLRGWRAAHMRKTWADIGYNYGVDGSGRIWNLTGNNVGAHAGGDGSGNTSTVGVLLVIGQGEKPNAAMIQGVKELHAELLEALPKATKVYGHRDWVSTECPGAAVYAAIKAGTFSGKPDRTDVSNQQPKDWLSMATEAEIVTAIWETKNIPGPYPHKSFPDGHWTARAIIDVTAKRAQSAATDAAATLALTKVLVERGTSLTAADIEAAVKAGIDAKIDSATVNLSTNE